MRYVAPILLRVKPHGIDSEKGALDWKVLEFIIFTPGFNQVGSSSYYYRLHTVSEFKRDMDSTEVDPDPDTLRQRIAILEEQLREAQEIQGKGESGGEEDSAAAHKHVEHHHHVSMYLSS